MLSENIKAIRKSKGLSQEELAIKLHVVRQTISKWEQGLSVPDAEMLLALSAVLETPVSTLLGETASESKPDDVTVLAEKLEVINMQLASAKAAKRKTLHILFISLCAIMMLVFAVLLVLDSPYLDWDYSNPEAAVAGVGFHAFEWFYVRIAPPLLIGAIAGIILTRKRPT